MMEDKYLVEVKHLQQYFPVAGSKLFEKKVVKAVDNVSFGCLLYTSDAADE